MDYRIQSGLTARLLYEENFNSIWARLSTWRIDSFYRQMEEQQLKGRILPFVRGLRFSALLIYAIRDILSGSGLTADWGHLLDEDETFCSCECDIIIHRNGFISRWNGDGEEPIMNFKFIKQQAALAVISCKSYLKSSGIDKEYCKSMKPFVEKIWLFAECCGPRSAKSLQEKAIYHGYERFWFLYTWSRSSDIELNKDGWNQFVQELKALKK